MQALTWLKANKKLYANIEIDYERIRMLPENGNVESQIKTVKQPTDNSEPSYLDDTDSWLPDTDLPASCLPFCTLPNQDEQAKAFFKLAQAQLPTGQ